MSRLQDKIFNLKQKQILEYWKGMPYLSELLNKADSIIYYPESDGILKKMSSNFDMYYYDVYRLIDRMEFKEPIYLFLYAKSHIMFSESICPIFKFNSINNFCLRSLLNNPEVYCVKISNLSFSKIIDIDNIDNPISNDLRDISIKHHNYRNILSNIRNVDKINLIFPL